MIIAVIPARGGSKRIPGKNIREFHGKPMIAYSIETALATDIFDRVIVSTDDENIASIARRFGAETPFTRPDSLSDDNTGTNAVVKHALDWLREQEQTVEYVCCIYATAPLLRAQDVKDGYHRLLASKKSFAFSVARFPAPIQRAFRIVEAKGLEMIWPEHAETRSQDLEASYFDAGQFYWGLASAFQADLPLYSSHSVPLVIPRERVQDIDDLEDWRHAEILFEFLNRER